MQLGFIGTGEITSSIVTGLSSSGVTAHSLWLSPRNSATANGLANRFQGISVASCNQEVLDHSDTIVIAVRPSAARDVLSELALRPDHQVISLVSALSLRSLSELAGVGTVFPVERENEVDAICATTATIASYFAFSKGMAMTLIRPHEGTPSDAPVMRLSTYALRAGRRLAE